MSIITPVEAGSIIGIDFKNPLNLKSPYDKSLGYWFGQIGEDPKGHAVFADWLYSMRGNYRNLERKWKNGKKTILAIAEDWAPRNDPQANNRPDVYATNVSKRMGGIPVGNSLQLFKGNGEIDRQAQLFDLVLAMVDEEIYSGFSGYLDNGLLVAAAELYYKTNVIKSITP